VMFPDVDVSKLPSIAVVTLNARVKTRSQKQSTTGHIRAGWQHALSFANKKAYCDRHKIDLIVEGDGIVDMSRDVAWSKVPIFKKWLPKYQWIMWMDMDAFFMRMDIDVRKFIDGSDKDVIISKDWHGINMGVFFIRNSKYTFALLDEMWKAPRRWWIPWEEQSALMKITDPKYSFARAREHLKHFEFVAQREINSYPGQFAYGNRKSLYRVGDFIAHFPNCKAFLSCKRTIQRYYEEAVRRNNMPKMDDSGHGVPETYFPKSAGGGDVAVEVDGQQQQQQQQPAT